MRGGTASSTVIVSDEKIGSPVVVKPDVAIIFNEASLEKYEEDVKKNGLIILNISQSTRKVQRKDVTVLEIEATRIAKELGNEKSANFVMLGAYLKESKLIKIESALKMIKKVLPKLSEEIIELNKKALLKGYGEH
jgi:2-oxoglutarate ferredoxin oxidoreductase subunit gamma